jgi:hypothetical protein
MNLTNGRGHLVQSDKRAERPIDEITIAYLQKLLRDKLISWKTRKNRTYYVDRLLHGSVDDEDYIDEDNDENVWTTCTHDNSFPYSTAAR